MKPQKIKDAPLYDIYVTDRNDALRYALGRRGPRCLLVIGLNPSTADQYTRDQTLTRVEGFTRRRSSGLIMCNLYPLRATDPNDLPQRPDPALVRENTQQVVRLCREHDVQHIWAAWGDPIEKRPFLSTCLYRLYEALDAHPALWLKCGSTTRKGHPRHPSRLAYKHRFSPFDVARYIAGELDRARSA